MTILVCTFYRMLILINKIIRISIYYLHNQQTVNHINYQFIFIKLIIYY